MRFTGAVSRILLGSLIGQGTLLLVSPILTRLYAPEDFGAFAMITAVCAVLGSVSTLSWERAVVLPREEVDSRALVALGMITMAAIISIIAVLAFIGRELLAEWSGVPILSVYWWVIPVTLVAMAMNALVSAIIVRRQDYSGLAVRNASQGVAQAAWGVGLGALGASPLGLISSLAVGRFIGLFGLGIRRRRIGIPRGQITGDRLVAAARRYKRFPLINAWSSAINSIGLQLPAILLIFLYGAVEAGLFALTVRVLAAPVGMIVDAVSKHFESTFARALRAEQPVLQSMVKGVVKRQALIGAIPALIVLIGSPVLFEWVFGAQWARAGTFAQVVLLAYLAQFIVVPVSRALVLLERQVEQFWWDVSRAVAAASAIIAVYLVQLDIVWALGAWASVQVFSYLMMFLLVKRAARRGDADFG